MKIPEQIALKVVDGNMRTLFDMFTNLEGEYEGYEEDYELVRYGINIPFEIHDLWENTNSIIRKDKDKVVIINNKKYNLSDYRTEKEKRHKIMVNAILNNIDLNETIAPRND